MWYLKVKKYDQEAAAIFKIPSKTGVNYDIRSEFGRNKFVILNHNFFYVTSFIFTIIWCLIILMDDSK